MSRKLVGVFPAAEHAARRRLFGALESAFDVEFVGRDGADASGLDAVVLVRGRGEANPVSAPVPVLLVTPSDRRVSGGVQFDDGSHVDERLRGRSLREEDASAVGAPGRGERPVASGPDGPCWLVRHVGDVTLHHVAALPRELRDGEPLKALLRAGCFLGLLPMVQFLREVASRGWAPMPLRASFILDDPNLHWRSYGHIRYPELADHAARHQYHVGIAMVPIDAAFAHGATVDLFRRRPELSLLIHGNDHVKWELARPHTSPAALAIAAQSLRRMARFERRNRLPVCRVIVPPHDDCTRERTPGIHPPPGACSEDMMEALLHTGFEAVCYYGPTGDSRGRSLVGWLPSDVHVGGGLPGIHRMPFDTPVEELVLRSYLDQPLVLFGHHGDLSDLNLLADAAARINGLGEVVWSSMTGITRSNFTTRLDGTTLHLGSFARRITVDVPPGVDRIVLELTRSHVDPPNTLALAPVQEPDGAGMVRGEVGTPLAVAGPAQLEIALSDTRSADPDHVPSGPWKPWPVVRRCLTEGRDRLRPLLRR